MSEKQLTRQQKQHALTEGLEKLRSWTTEYCHSDKMEDHARDSNCYAVLSVIRQLEATLQHADDCLYWEAMPTPDFEGADCTCGVVMPKTGFEQ